MKNKKLVIALSVFSSVLLIAVVSLVAVLAAFQTQATGGFTVSYTAYNVNADICGRHKSQNDSEWQNLKPTGATGNVTHIIFDSNNVETTSRSFDVANIQMKKNEYYIVSFYIQNSITTDDVNTTSDNIIFSGSVANFNDTGNLRAYTFVADGWSDLDLKNVNLSGESSDFSAFNSVTIEPGKFKTMSIVFKIVNPTISVTGYDNVKFNFTLTVAQ